MHLGKVVAHPNKSVHFMKRLRKSRGGRPRSTRPAIDLGTPELQRYRMSAVGPARMVDGKMISPDPAKSTCPLDIALSRGYVDQSEYDAARHFVACHAIKFGSPHPHAVDLSRVSMGSDETRDTAGAEAAYRHACVALRKQSRATLDAVENFLIHERMPKWLVTGDSSRDRDKLMNGLHILHVWHTSMKSRAA